MSEQLNEKDGEISKLEQKVKDSKKSEETLHKQIDGLSMQVNKDVEMITMLQATEAQARMELGAAQKLIK